MTEKIITGVASDTVKIRTVCGKLAIKMETTDQSALDMDSPSILIYVQNPQGGKRKTVCDEVSIRKLFEIETLDPESNIRIYGNSDISGVDSTHLIQTNVDFEITGRIDLTQLNGLELEKDDELYLELKNLDAALGKYTIRSLEDDEMSKDYINYAILSTESSKNRKFGTLGKKLFAIQRNAALQSVELRYLNGSVVKMSPDEMDDHCRDLYGICYNYVRAQNGGAMGFIHELPQKQHIIPLQNVKEIQVNTDGTALEVILVGIEG